MALPHQDIIVFTQGLRLLGNGQTVSMESPDDGSLKPRLLCLASEI